jgi:Tol biopolymer transport system component
MMKRSLTTLLTSVLLLCAATSAFAQSGADLFQQGLRKERVDGDLKAAIAIYQRVVKENAKDHALAAKALVELGGAYEKLGNSEAKAAYERVISEYGEQSEQASLARARLAALSASANLASQAEPIVRRVWTGPGVDASGAPTPDGKLLTFVDWETGDLAVRDLATGEKRRLTNKGTWEKSNAYAFHPVPSRDGKLVAYGFIYNTQQREDLRIVGIDGGEPRVVYTNPEVDFMYPNDWSPDGSQILMYMQRKDHTSQIALVNSSDGTVRVLKSLDWRGTGKMSFSPDGKYIAYDFPAREDVEQRDIYVLASDGSSESVLVNHPANDAVAGWSPDGKYVLFASNRTGNMSLWLAPVKDGKAAGEAQVVRRDVEVSASALPMGFTRDGSFFYGADVSPQDVYLASFDSASGKVRGAPTRMVEQYVGANSRADWSHNSKFVVYASKRRPGPRYIQDVLIVRNTATDAEHVVPTPLSYPFMPRWSPDDRYLAVGGVDQKGRDGIFRVDPVSGETTMLVPANGHYVGMAGWSADGRSLIYYLQNIPDSTVAVVMQAVDGSESHDLYRVTGKAFTIQPADVSPDGRQVAFNLWEHHRYSAPQVALMIVPTSGGEARDLVRMQHSDAWSIGWSADSRSVFYSSRRITQNPDSSLSVDYTKMPLMRVSAAGGAPVETGLAMDELDDVRAHPDGQRVSFTSGRGGTEVWVMENFLPGPQKPTSTKKR